VTFNIRVPHAKGLPAKFNNNVFVSFDFHDKSFQTDPVPGKSTDPQFKFETRVAVPQVTEEVKDYLFKEAAIFEVKGYSDSAESEILSSAGGEGKDGDDAQCSHCDDAAADIMCVDCAGKFCTSCYELLHKSPRKATHKKMAIGDGPADRNMAHTCNHCEDAAPIIQCTDCNLQLCESCDQLLHKAKSKATHHRQPIDEEGGEAQTSGAGSCEHCEEEPAVVKCDDCDTSFCKGCEELLHRSAKKSGHTRNAL
jgi:hypothetical protein